MRKFFLIAFAIVLIGLASPARADGGDVAGTLIGAGLGGFLGNQIGHGPGRDAATIAGVILGGVIGNQVGSSLDRSYYNSPAYYQAYSSPAYFTPTEYEPNYVAPPAPPPEVVNTYYDAPEQSYCREYTQHIRVEGQMQESYGTACLQPDGSWRVVD